MTPVSTGSLSFSGKGGRGGDGGRHGIRGEGGDGGEGGYNAEFREGGVPTVAGDLNNFELLKDQPSSGEAVVAGTKLAELNNALAFAIPDRCIKLESTGPTGPAGEPGTAIPGDPPKGPDGASLDTSRSLVQVEPVDIGQNGSISQWKMALHSAENDYLGGRPEQLERSVTILNWLDSITENLTMPPELNAFRVRVLLLLTQLSAGLDFFGLPRNYVPTVALDRFKTTVTSLLTLATSIEETYLNYALASKNIDDRRAALGEAIGKTNASILALKNQQDANITLANNTQAVVAALLQSLLEQEEILKRASADFQRAVEARAGCSFLDVLAFIANVVAVAAGAFQDIKELSEQVATFDKTDKALKEIVKSLKAVGKDLGEMKAAFQNLKKFINDNGADAAKIVVERGDFEEELKPFLDLPEAREFRKQIRRYFQLADTRNNKILEFTALVLRNKEIDAEIARMQSEVEKLKIIIVKENNPDLVECVTFMGQLMAQAKTRIVKALYQEFRAFEYWSLSDGLFPFVGDEDIARLKATQLIIEDSELQAREARGAAVQPFPPVEVVLNESDFLDEIRDKHTAWQEFQETGQLNFEIPIDHPEFAGINTTLTVSSINITVHDAKTPNNRLTLGITHSGFALFKTGSGVLRRYTHKPRTRLLFYDLLTGKPRTSIENNLGGEDGNFI